MLAQGRLLHVGQAHTAESARYLHHEAVGTQEPLGAKRVIEGVCVHEAIDAAELQALQQLVLREHVIKRELSGGHGQASAEAQGVGQHASEPAAAPGRTVREAVQIRKQDIFCPLRALQYQRHGPAGGSVRAMPEQRG